MSPSTVRDDLHATAEDTAAAWLLQRDGGRDVEGDPEFRAWHDGDPLNAAAWARAVATWDAVGGAGDDPLFTALRRDALQARPPRLPRFAAVAAAMVVVILGGFLAWPQIAPRVGPAAPPGPAADAPATFANGGGPPNTFALADGSRVTLSADSAIAVAYDERRRAVRLLRGQAYFSVVPDGRARPFTVAAAARTVTDLGTEFDVRLRDQALTVTLVKGSVSVSRPDGKPTTLSAPGQQLTARPGQADTVTQADVGQAMSWRTRMLEFSDQPLAEVIAETNRYGGPPARVVDASVAALPVTGRFRAGDPSRFADALAVAYPLTVRTRPDGGADISRR